MNLPNKLTILRIVLVPFIVLVWLFPYEAFGINMPLFYIGNLALPLLNIIILILFSFASFTDFLDGYLARKNDLITTFGKFADPIADKLLVNTMLLFLATKNMIPLVPVFIMLSRDIIVDGCRMIASRNGVVVAASYFGKAKTVTQMLAIISVLLNNIPFEFYNFPLTTLLIWLASFFSLFSGYAYFDQLKDYIFESM